MAHSESTVIITGCSGTSTSSTLPATRVQISSDASRGEDGLAVLYSTTKDFKLYYDGNDSAFSTFDDVFYELLVYKPRRTKKVGGTYYDVYKGFVHPITVDAPTKHAGSSTHNGLPSKGTTEWSVVGGVWQKTPVSIDFRYFFKDHTGASISFPMQAVQTIKLLPRMDVYIPATGGSRKARKLAIAFRLCGMKVRAGGGYDYTYGPTSNVVAVYPEVRKNRGEVSVDTLGNTIPLGGTYYSGISANFSDISTHSDFF